MADRDLEEQNEHDIAVRDIANNTMMYPEWGEVIINPGQEKNRDIRGQYPDIIFVDPNTGTELMIGEVETESSVNEYEAEHQWQDYANLNTPFSLFVPDSCLQEASELIKRYNIKATIHLYNYRFGTLQLV